jgi:predicted enzyme related to lactoylglutathione lyase
MPKVIHFNITADDVQRAIDFYTRVFDWKFEKYQGNMEYWLATTGGDDESGIDGGLSERGGGLSFNAFVNTVEVQDIDAYVVRIKMNGGKTLSPKVAIYGVGYLVPCEDTEGNRFAIMELDESAR